MILLIIAICLILLTWPFWVALFALGVILFGVFFKFIATCLLLAVIAGIGVSIYNYHHPANPIR